MPRRSPYQIALTAEEKAELEALARRYTAPYCAAVRAKVVLFAAQGLSNDEIARRLDLPREQVSKWRKRFWEEGLAGLEDRSREGRPPVFSPLD
ncbi:MAG: helix-turn-helix domain-containing protein [Armatimonadota bacterium]|jgi:transposase